MAEDFARKMPDAGARFADRRSSPRFAFVAEVAILEPISGTRIAGRTSEISVGGCYVAVLNPLPPSTVVQICILREKENFASWGRIAYTHEGIGMGVSFFKTLPEQLGVIREWIEELCL